MSVIPRVNERGLTLAFPRSLTLYHVTAAAVFMAMLAIAVVPRFDTDVWWHLFVGRHIFAGGGVPSRDFLSFTVPSHAWIDHEWLAEVGMYAAYKVGGYKLLISLFGVVTMVAFMLVLIAMRLRGVGQLFALGITMLAAGATVAAWGPRVQVLSLLFAAIFCLGLERYRATAGVEWLIGLVIAMWLWSNLHGGFVVGFILMGVYLVGGTFDRVQGGMPWSVAVKRQRPLLLTLLTSFAVTFVNPNTYRQLTYPLRFLTPNAFTNAIQESQSPNFHLYQQLPFEVLLLGLIAGALLVRRRVSWIDILLSLVMTYLALQQTRNIALWCVVVTPIVAVYLQEAAAPLLERRRGTSGAAAGGVLMAANWVLLLVVMVGGAALIARIDSPEALQAAEFRSFPAGAVRYIDHHTMAGNLFNGYSYGGYLIWKTGADYPVFIDSRADTVYPDATLHDYQTIYGAQPGWSALLDRYRIGWVFVENTAPIDAVLSQLPNTWRVAYHGAEATILVRQGGKHA
jgi:hypothetical protein